MRSIKVRLHSGEGGGKVCNPQQIIAQDVRTDAFSFVHEKGCASGKHGFNQSIRITRKKSSGNSSSSTGWSPHMSARHSAKDNVTSTICALATAAQLCHRSLAVITTNKKQEGNHTLGFGLQHKYSNKDVVPRQPVHS